MNQLSVFTWQIRTSNLNPLRNPQKKKNFHPDVKFTVALIPFEITQKSLNSGKCDRSLSVKYIIYDCFQYTSNKIFIYAQL